MKPLGLVLAALVLVAVGCGDDGETGEEGGAVCGDTTCLVTEYCCDASCGLCIDEGLVCPDSC